MAGYKRLSHDDRVRICTLANEHISNHELSRRFNVHRATVINLLRKYRSTGSVDDRQRKGRPRMTSLREDRRLLRISKSNPAAVSGAVRQLWIESGGLPLSKMTVKRRLIAGGLHGQIAVHKPLLTARHRKRRLEWALQHRHWTVDMWRRVVFSDEVPLPLVQTKERRYIRCRRGGRMQCKIFQPRIQAGGGSIMLWGAFTASGTIPLVRVQGTLNAERYTQVLTSRLLPWISAPGEFIFQQDNASCHTAKFTKKFMVDHGITLLPWPAMSPDMNPLENLWSSLKRDINKVVIHGLDNLFIEASRIFSGYTPDVLDNLVSSMPRRIEEVIKMRGGRTSY